MKFSQDGKDIPKALFDAIKEDGLIDSGERVLVAFSGGADSVALLTMLSELKEKLNIELYAAHLNHGIRGEEADRDESFCRKLCLKLGVPFTAGHVSVPSESERTGEGLEECARRLRYAFLNESAEKHGCGKIATAHHADDNVETVLLHMIRGAGLSGLVGISPKRGNLIRPLLRFRKNELLAYLEETGQEYVTDSTNSDLTMTRNKIRHKLLDTVYEINPRAHAAVASLGRLADEDNRYLVSLAEGVDKNASLDELSGLPLPILSRFLQLRYAEHVNESRINENGLSEDGTNDIGASDIGKRSRLQGKRPPQLSYVHITPITDFIKTGTGRASFTLPGGITAHVSARGVVFRKTEKAPIGQYWIPLKYGENNISQYGYKILITNDKNVADEWQNIYKLSIPTIVNSGTIPNGKETGLFVRSLRPSDRYAYGGHTRDVRHRLIDKKIPAYERSRLPCICDGNGIIFVPHLRAADRAFPKKGDTPLYIIYVSTEK